MTEKNKRDKPDRPGSGTFKIEELRKHLGYTPPAPKVSEPKPNQARSAPPPPETKSVQPRPAQPDRPGKGGHKETRQPDRSAPSRRPMPAAFQSGGLVGAKARLPLPRDLQSLVAGTWHKTAHPGLAFARFPDTWLNGWKAGGPEKKEFFKKIIALVAEHGKGSEARSFNEAFRSRRSAMFEALKQAGWLVELLPPLKTDWRLVSGLGIAHPFEAGFVFHHTYGVPYLPGSSVKGAARAWAEESGWDYSVCEVIFGPDEHPPDQQPDAHGRKKPFVPSCGRAVFFDAFPIAWPKLDLDIINPHYKAYYEGNEPPADWLSPEPTYFLTVAPGTQWEFAVAVPPDSLGLREELKTAGLADPAALLEKAVQSVRGAATELGLGGKTAVGYGYFAP